MAFASCRRRAPSLLGGAAVSWCSSPSHALGRRAPTLLDCAAVSWCRSLSHGPLRGGRRPAREEEHQRSPLPNVAAHFAEITNAVLKRLNDEGTSDKMYDEFMQGAKKKLIHDLEITYKDLYNFYTNPSKMIMPSWLSESPIANRFTTDEMDKRLLSKILQIREDLRAFSEELGFVCLNVRYSDVLGSIVVTLRLDVSTVPTTEAHKDVENKLLTLGKGVAIAKKFRLPRWLW